MRACSCDVDALRACVVAWLPRILAAVVGLAVVPLSLHASLAETAANEGRRTRIAVPEPTFGEWPCGFG